MTCTRCNGQDSKCDNCGGRGVIVITSCPQKRIDYSTWQAVRCARLTERGILPIGGGLLEQSAQFAEAMDYVAAEESYHKARLGIT